MISEPQAHTDGGNGFSMGEVASMTGSMFGRLRRYAAVMMALTIPAAALAQLRSDTFRIQAGWTFTSTDSRLRVDGATTGTEIHPSDDLGVAKRDDTYHVSAEWRFAERHRLSIGYFEINRSGTSTLSKNVTIEDITFPAGSSATTEFATAIAPVAYSYSFFKSPDSEFAGTLGLHWTKLRLSVRGQSNTNVGVFDREASATVEGPLPLLGLRYDYAFTPAWRLLTHGEYFYLKVGGKTSYKGSMLNLRVATEYDIFRNVALGLSYTYFALDANADDSDWKGTVDYKYHGPAIYVVAQF